MCQIESIYGFLNCLCLYLKGRLDGDAGARVLDEVTCSPSPLFLVFVAREPRCPQLSQQVPGERLQCVKMKKHSKYQINCQILHVDNILEVPTEALILL